MLSNKLGIKLKHRAGGRFEYLRDGEGQTRSFDGTGFASISD